MLLNVKSTVTKKPVEASSSPNVKLYFFEKGGFGPLFLKKTLYTTHIRGLPTNMSAVKRNVANKASKLLELFPVVAILGGRHQVNRRELKLAECSFGRL